MQFLYNTHLCVQSVAYTYLHFLLFNYVIKSEALFATDCTIHFIRDHAKLEKATETFVKEIERVKTICSRARVFNCGPWEGRSAGTADKSITPLAAVGFIQPRASYRSKYRE